jgi:hypothetical protein
MKSQNLSSETIPVEEDDGGFSDPYNIPDDFWENGVWEYPEGKEHISIRVEHFVLDYFKRSGPGYQARINSVLRSYVLHQMLKEAEAKGRQSTHDKIQT